MVNVTMYKSAQKLLPELEICDIVEFSRFHYSHFGFYIGDGICIHVQGPDKDSSCSTGTKCAEHLFKIADGDDVRINNEKVKAFLFNAKPRPVEEALALAKRGLPVDSNGNLLLGHRVNVDYSLLSCDNCEGYATYWKYEHNTGWSQQANNGIVHSSLGTVERFCGRVISDVDKKMDDEDVPVVAKVGLAALGGTSLVAKSATTAVKTTTDFIAGVGQATGIADVTEATLGKVENFFGDGVSDINEALDDDDVPKVAKVGLYAVKGTLKTAELATNLAKTTTNFAVGAVATPFLLVKRLFD